jgi:hypothetical protein
MDPAGFLALDADVAGSLAGPEVEDQRLGPEGRAGCDQGKEE